MIKILDRSTVDKIAAGEVIERPSSIVKELVENSIDAGATQITVEIKDGGTSMIRVTDNGSGIDKDDVRLAYMPHATSKINSAEDLSGVMTLGFRGEALSTIAAVSQTEMITKKADTVTGIKYVIHGGKEIEYREIGAPDGTTIVARNIFFNTPARLKFLKTNTTEGSYINDLITHLALSRPDISFRLMANGKTQIDTPGTGGKKEVIYSLYGRDITNNLIEINSEENGIKITGFIGKPHISKGNRSFENYFINNRYIKSRIINKAIEEGYKTFIMQHKFPFTVLYIELSPDMCDVNVHPTKMEFRYNREQELFTAVMHSVKNALKEPELIIETTYDTEAERKKEEHNESKERLKTLSEKKEGVPIRKTSLSPSYKILENLKKAEAEAKAKAESDVHVQLKPDTEVKITESPLKIHNDNVSYENAPLYQVSDTEKFLSDAARPRHRLIGQVFDTYWLMEYEDKLYIMDQHAAHEKVNYERFIREMKNKAVVSQALFPPEIISLSGSEKALCFDNLEFFEKTGFEIEDFGGNEIKINAMPVNLYGINGREAFLEFISDLSEGTSGVTEDMFVKKLSTMACKAAIKGNQHITFQEADALINELLKLENPYTCPHGRPTIISMSKTELEKKFKRIV